ncbi:MAG: Hsp20/alpha crystallin family protein [Myxococcota bacterium]
MSTPNPQTPVRPSASTPEADAAPVLTPQVDIFENTEEYRVVADLPGVAPGGVQLDLEQGELVLFARRSLSREGQVLAQGRREGNFRRVFRVPQEVDATKVEAAFVQGVLEVRLPKFESTKPRRIAINAV